MNTFSRLPSTRKGAIAEQYVIDLLTTRGWHIYRYSQDTSHPVDLVAITNDGLVLVEVKCKSARDYYPDTGIDLNDHYKYHELCNQTQLPLLLLFVDPKQANVYGQYLHELSQPVVVQHNGRELVYPLVADRYIYYPLSLMEVYANLPPAVVEQLNRFYHPRYPNPLPPRVGVDKNESDVVQYDYGWLDVPTTDEPNQNDG